MTTLRRYVTYVAVGAAGFFLLAILASILPISIGLFLPQSSTFASSDGMVDSILSVARSYLFRQATRNTLVLLGLTLPIALGLGIAGVALARQGKRNRGAMAWLLLLPLAMPIALTMPAWRQIFAPTLALSGEDLWPTLLAVAFIQAWRILPFATLFLLLAHPLHWRSPAIGLTLSFSAYMVLSDVAIVLLLNGGAPFNASQLLTSWIYQTGVTAGMPAQAAMMTLVLVPMLTLLAWGNIHFSSKMQRRTSEPGRDDAPQVPIESATQPTHPLAGTLLTVLALFVLLLPVSVVLVKSADVRQWPDALSRLFTQTDFLFWAANTFLLASITALATVIVALPVGQRIVAWKSPWASRLSSALGILGMTALPISFGPLAGLQAERHFGDGRWVLALIYIAICICIGTWVVTLTVGENRQIQRSTVVKWLVMLSFLIVTHEMGVALTLSNGHSRAQGLGSGLASRLLFDPSIAPTVIGIAILLPTILLLLFYWWLLRGSVAVLVEPYDSRDLPQVHTDGQQTGDG